MKNESNIKEVGLIALLGIGALILLSKSKKQQSSDDVALTLTQVALEFGWYSYETGNVERLISDGKLRAFKKDGELFIWKSELGRYFALQNPIKRRVIKQNNQLLT